MVLQLPLSYLKLLIFHPSLVSYSIDHSNRSIGNYSFYSNFKKKKIKSNNYGKRE